MRRLIAVCIGLMVMGGGAHADNAGDGTHVTIPDPASLSGARAEQVYRSIQSTLQQRYLEAGDPIGAAYQQWQRFNTVPYRSSVHGERFVNNFVNDIATPSYALFENVAAMPAGSIVIKDSFAVTAKGDHKDGESIEQYIPQLGIKK